MATSKLSQITPAIAAPALTDQVVGVTGGITDNLFTLAQIAATATAAGTIYYVSTAGSDSNNGQSAASPWQTIAHVNTQTFHPGDSILFGGNQTFSGAIICPSAGTPSRPITFGSYGGDRATISSGTANGFSSTNQDGIIVRDLIFTGSGSGTGKGLFFLTTLNTAAHFQNVQIINCTISGYGNHGIYFLDNGSSSSGYDDVLIKGCTVSNCTAVVPNSTFGNTCAAIYLNGAASLTGYSFSNVTISQCVVHDNTGAAGATNHTGDGIELTSCVNGLIDSCLAYNNGAVGKFSGGIWFFDCSHSVIANCEVYNQRTAVAADGNGFDLDQGCSHCSIINCYSHDNYGAGYLLDANDDGSTVAHSNNSIINCISENDAANPSSPVSSVNIGLSGTMANNVFEHCLFYQSISGVDLIHIDQAGFSATNCKFTGNTFIVTATQNFITTTANPSFVFQGNRYVGNFKISWNGTTYTALNAWTAAVPAQELVGIPLIIGKASSKAGLPTTSDLAASQWGVFKDTSGGGVYVAYNDAGTIKKVALV